jgi:UDP-glucose:(heptosyl)LPS alpha-1,3-glucosyltransferase
VNNYKLAFAVDRYFEFGGMQRSFLRIARECAKRGHDIHVFTGKWSAPTVAELTVHLLDAQALTNHGRKKKFDTRLRTATANGFDCIVGSTKVSGLDVYYGGDPCYVARVDEIRGFFYKLMPRYHVLRQLEQEVFGANRDTEIMLIAHGERDKFMRYYGTEPERFHLLPPGIDKQRLLKSLPTEETQSNLRRELNLAADDLVLLNVGSRFKTKGIDRAIIALAGLPDDLRRRTTLVVVGGDNPNRFMHLATKLGVADRVIFTGARDDVAAFYSIADLLIHPSYTENTGTTIIEAMVCGLPVLATENCGFAFHVEKAQAGLVCPLPFEQENLNKMVAEMLTTDRRTDWGKSGSAYCQRTDLYSLIERAADIIIARAARNRNR